MDQGSGFEQSVEAHSENNGRQPAARAAMVVAGYLLPNTIVRCRKKRNSETDTQEVANLPGSLNTALLAVVSSSNGDGSVDLRRPLLLRSRRPRPAMSPSSNASLTLGLVVFLDRE